MFSSDKWLSNPASGFYPHSIGQSLRFEDGDSPRLTRTPSSAGNRKTWTFSAWVKRGNISAGQFLFQAYDGASSRRSGIKFNSNDTIAWDQGGNASSGLIDTVAVYRDVSSFYHIVGVADYSNGTAGNRAKIYVNGVLQTVTTSDDFENADGLINSTNEHSISFTSSNFFDGYMAEVHFIDGTALGPDSFGETKDGIWVPKNVSGLTYGTNGFHLDFADSSSIGNDVSGQNNDFAVSGLVASDVVLDSVTNNFATLNGVHPNAATGNFSEGNLRSYQDQSPYTDFYATFAVSAGKWYWEARAAGTAIQQIWGFSREDALTTANGGAVSGTTGYAYFRFGSFARERANGSNANASGTLSVAAGDVIGLALNLDDNEVKFYKNGTLEHTITGVQDGTYYPFVCYQMNQNRLEQRVNFGQDSTFAGLESAGGNSDDNGIGDFAQSPISGHLAICSANLPEPSIISGEDYFNTVLYAGDGSNGLAITGVNFQPNWTWIKHRTISANHELHDSVRGAGKRLFSNDVAAEGDVGTVSSFDSDGFTVSRNSAYDGTNQNAKTFVSWNWLAGGSASLNENGTVDSQVSANTEAGFSIATFTGGAAGYTVGHGLTKAPEIIFTFNRTDDGGAHYVFTTAVDGTIDYFSLNASTAKNNDPFSMPAFTNTVFSLDNDYGMDAGDNCVAYCFHSVEGFSKVGVYRGNGNADGTYVHTGFRPAWVMVKSHDNSRNWTIYDNKRTPYNLMNGHLHPNASVEEQFNEDELDFLSNGFKFRTNEADSNFNNFNYLYLCFAEQPFKYSNAR